MKNRTSLHRQSGGALWVPIVGLTAMVCAVIGIAGAVVQALVDVEDTSRMMFWGVWAVVWTGIFVVLVMDSE